MRELINLNASWAFAKEVAQAPEAIDAAWETVTLPHSWNAIDGQDGGADYFRGSCCYAKELKRADLPTADHYYLEICGANSSADVYVGGKHLAHHDGGYSTWRVDITEALGEQALVAIVVDNAANETVYPQMADFTFYGGLYRNVNILCVADSHFDLDTYGCPGIKITPVVDGANANVEIEVAITNKTDSQVIKYTLFDADGKMIDTAISADTKASFVIENVHLWHGRKDPYLYSATAELIDGEAVLDNVSSRFGCRSFHVDPEKGFFLNGESYPLRGVSRHQDRWGFGNALLPEHHKEDMELICEVGATTIRLAHYQHDQYFYDLCDEYGQIIWAEIPYISKHMPGGRENTISQMKELIIQNYNHPSIVVWGLSNEITMNGASDPDLLENHHILNDLAHEMDPTRLTTMAVLSMCDMNEGYVHISDVVSYNHYFGWYGGTTDMNGPWFDKFHAAHPNKPIGVSEYGCEALNWHTSEPKQGDYTEEYQAYYHEELIKQLFTRPYIWSTHVWNMFDFGADARNEGGENGQNHKGLMTFDRSYKKDAFYAYKAWLSDEPFVHICGKRYVDRVEDVTKVTVYSNQPEVELLVNGESLGKIKAADHFFYFNVPNVGESTLVAIAGDCRDESTLRKVDTFNEEYLLKEKGAILNWFDVTTREGYFDLNTPMGDIMKTLRGKLVLMQFGASLMSSMKKNQKEGKTGGMGGNASGMKFNSGMMEMLGGFSILRASNMIGMVGATITKEQLLKINKKLNRIKMPTK